MITVEKRCKDYGGNPNCLGTIDERYTLRFDDIGEDPVEFCAHCGPGAMAMNEALEKFFEERPEEIEKLRILIEKAEAQIQLEKS